LNLRVEKKRQRQKEKEKKDEKERVWINIFGISLKYFFVI
jgi:hypothetical protein